jgi:hypothetical protein
VQDRLEVKKGRIQTRVHLPPSINMFLTHLGRICLLDEGLDATEQNVKGFVSISHNSRLFEQRFEIRRSNILGSGSLDQNSTRGWGLLWTGILENEVFEKGFQVMGHRSLELGFSVQRIGEIFQDFWVVVSDQRLVRLRFSRSKWTGGDTRVLNRGFRFSIGERRQWEREVAACVERQR